MFLEVKTRRGEKLFVAEDKIAYIERTDSATSYIELVSGHGITVLNNSVKECTVSIPLIFLEKCGEVIS